MTVIAIHMLAILGNMWYTELHSSSEVIDDDRLAMVATVTWKYHFRHGPWIARSCTASISTFIHCNNLANNLFQDWCNCIDHINA